MSMIVKTEEIIIDTNEYNSDEADEMHLTLEDSGGEQNYQQSYQEQDDQDQDDIIQSPQHRQHSGGNIISPNTTPSSKTNQSDQPVQSKTMMENEKRIRREIANSNERRRMQSINAGFQSLRSLLPRHEGEKLSKAAILQQTAQYILDLEREKSTLLSQNSQLKRQHCQQESAGGGGGGGNCVSSKTADSDGIVTVTVTNATSNSVGGLKKRKIGENIISMQTISDSSDEGVGSMSPEPMTLISTAGGTITAIQGPQPIQSKPATAYINSTAKEVNELRTRLDNERKRRQLTEERLRSLERQLYQTTTTSNNVIVNNQYSQREVIEHTDNIREEEIMIINEAQHHQQQQLQQHQHYQNHHHHQQTQSLKIDPIKLQVVEIDSLPSVGQTQVVVSIEDMQEDEADIINDMNIREEVIMTDENTEIVEVSSRLQPILEAAIKAEPKVEVERINATISKIKGENSDKSGDCVGGGGGGANNTAKRVYLTSTSRQNLETIVEAIRHLEGDHLFGDNIAAIEQPQQQHPKKQQQHQEVPLALTTATTTTTTPKHHLQQQQQQQQQQHPQLKSQRNLTKDLSPFLQLKKSSSSSATATSNLSNNCKIINSSGTNKINNSSNQTIHTTLPANNTAKTYTIKTDQSSIITATQMKQCRPGVIVAKQTS